MIYLFVGTLTLLGIVGILSVGYMGFELLFSRERE